MATQTTNYNLTKPAATDFYDISVPNGNMDIIDAALKNRADEIAGVDGRLDTAESNIASHGTKLAGIEMGADVTDAENVASSIHGSTAKTTPVDNDEVALIDSTASNVLKKTTWASIKDGINSDYTRYSGYSVDTGVTDAYAVTLSPAPTSYVDGMRVMVRIVNANTTTTPTLNVNGLGAKTIEKANDTVLTVGNLSANCTYEFVYSTSKGKFMLVGGDSDAYTLRGLTPDSAISTSIYNASEKTAPVDADMLGLMDSAAGNVLKKLSLANIKATIKTYFDTLYNNYVHPNHSGDVTSVGDGTQTITNKAVTLEKMADMATASLIYRKTTGSGVPEVNSLATLKTDLGLTGTNSGDQTLASLGGLALAGGTMTGILTSQSNTSYTTKQVRNIILSTTDADVNSMADGDIWIKYV